MDKIEEWLRSAAEAMPEADAFAKSRPGSSTRYVCGSGWALSSSGANEKTVAFEFINGDGVRAYLTIDRIFGTIGARV